MKKPNQTIQLVVMLLAVFLITSCNYKKKIFNPDIRFRTIVLQVNTADINPGDSIEQYASFPDQLSGEPDIDYTTYVNPGDKILWIGVSSSNPFEDFVLIEQIDYQGGENLLGKDTINGKNGIVMATIMNEGDEEKYTIHFKVRKSGGGLNPTYSIDPKLQILR